MNHFDLDAATVERGTRAEVGLLRTQGLRRGDAVGWLGLNAPRALSLLAACEQLGLRYVPLNWRLAAPELARIVEDAGLQRLLHDEAMAGLAGKVGALAPWPRPRSPGHQEGDLMLVYTSGTTGEPKGAIHTADAMRANARAAIEVQGLDAATRTLAVLPLFHVGGLCIQVLPTLAAGGTVRLHDRFDPAAWLQDVAQWRPTTSLMVPATMRAVIEHPDWPRTDLSSLAFINSGSSIVPRSLIEAFHARGVPVCQVYGATETGPVSIVLRPSQAMQQAGHAGWPAPGVQVRLEDGEVWLRAPNLARGYHGHPDDPAFAGGWFRSGDLALRHADGAYEIVGRRKELIISGGENIHPAQIEGIALDDPAVAEAAAVGLPDERWGEVPVLALLPKPGAVIDEARLRAAFESRLARFKHPRRIVRVTELPKTALGKVQRAELARRLMESKSDDAASS